jgi:aminoglycoside N3'-acetyltransferase
MTAAQPTIAADLRRLGVHEGDLLMVHASMRALGPIEGGADGLINALQVAVGRGGTLFMMLGARDDWDWVNQHPERERPALLADAPVFDYLTTAADPDVGVLAE